MTSACAVEGVSNYSKEDCIPRKKLGICHGHQSERNRGVVSAKTISRPEFGSECSGPPVGMRRRSLLDWVGMHGRESKGICCTLNVTLKFESGVSTSVSDRNGEESHRFEDRKRIELIL